MNRGLLFGAFACAFTSPASAGEKAVAGSARDPAFVAGADGALAHQVRVPVAAATEGATKSSVPRVAVFTLDARAAPVPAQRQASVLDAQPRPAEDNLRVITEAIDTTPRDGSVAVQDALAASRGRRGPRSVLRTMFVLRIDAEDQNPEFSIGGGGVAAAIWRAGQGG